MGFTLDDYGDEFTQVEVFPEDYQASIVFQSLLTRDREVTDAELRVFEHL